VTEFWKSPIWAHAAHLKSKIFDNQKAMCNLLVNDFNPLSIDYKKNIEKYTQLLLTQHKVLIIYYFTLSDFTKFCRIF